MGQNNGDILPLSRYYEKQRVWFGRKYAMLRQMDLKMKIIPSIKEVIAIFSFRNPFSFLPMLKKIDSDIMEWKRQGGDVAKFEVKIRL